MQSTQTLGRGSCSACTHEPKTQPEISASREVPEGSLCRSLPQPWHSSDQAAGGAEGWGPLPRPPSQARSRGSAADGTRPSSTRSALTHLSCTRRGRGRKISANTLSLLVLTKYHHLSCYKDSSLQGWGLGTSSTTALGTSGRPMGSRARTGEDSASPSWQSNSPSVAPVPEHQAGSPGAVRML